MNAKKIEKLKNDLIPIYENMLANITHEDVCTFAIQWGKLYPKENEGTLFVGKAVNSWIHASKNMSTLFGDSKNKIFNRNDQMDWIVDCGENEQWKRENYNTKKSAFWRVTKKVSQVIYPQNNWNKHIAWSNLYKVAPFIGGNPNNSLCNEQLEYCQKILELEINTLKPKNVIMLTSGWESDFLPFLIKQEKLKWDKTIKWNEFESKKIVSNGVTYIVTPHPQGKNEAKHVDAILKLINI